MISVSLEKALCVKWLKLTAQHDWAFFFFFSYFNMGWGKNAAPVINSLLDNDIVNQHWQAT